MFLLLCCLRLPQGIDAQAGPRDYAISPPPVRYSSDGASATVSFTVTNQGGDALEASQIVITENQSGRVEILEALPPLAAGQTQAFSFQLPLADFPEGDIFFKIEAGIDEFELAESPIARDNTQLFRINKANAGGAGGNGGATTTAPQRPSYDLFIPIINLGLNFLEDGIQLNESRVRGGDMLRALGIVAVALLGLWLLSLILRLIFRRPPQFEPWQPPYAANHWHDPNSTLGRRQSWQYHAQSSRIDAAGAPNQGAVVKRLLDKRGISFGSWQIKAMRAEQYDVYGRINKTEAVMPRKIVNHLNRVLRRAPEISKQELKTAIAPIAKRMSKIALAPIEEQNLMLPIALDIRFEGIADDVVIQFELYQFHDGAWRPIDQWQPELGPVGEHVPEHFTVSFGGQRAGESGKAYKRRLRDDLAQLLAGLFDQHQAAGEQPPGKPENRSDQPGAGEEQWERPTDDDETNRSPIPNR